jgi:acyl-CoA thioester hydrolase
MTMTQTLPRGHSFEDGRPTTPDVVHAVREYSITYHQPIRGTGEVLVHFWLDRFGESSGVYGFRFVSTDGRTVHADGRRIIVKLDPDTLRPSPWTAGAREVASALLRPS